METVELYTVEEAAKALRVSIFTMRAWIYQRKLAHVKLGRRVLIKAEDLSKFIEKNVNGR